VATKLVIQPTTAPVIVMLNGGIENVVVDANRHLETPTVVHKKLDVGFSIICPRDAFDEAMTGTLMKDVDSYLLRLNLIGGEKLLSVENQLLF
jgi:hypothetical protein